MANEKLFTAREAAQAVLNKARELLKNSNLIKAEPSWAKPEKDADQHSDGKAPKGEIHPAEKEQAPSDNVEAQKAPEANRKEQAEGNNEEWGVSPQTYGHLKLAKFIGHMEAKRKMRNPSNG